MGEGQGRKVRRARTAQRHRAQPHVVSIIRKDAIGESRRGVAFENRSGSTGDPQFCRRTTLHPGQASTAISPRPARTRGAWLAFERLNSIRLVVSHFADRTFIRTAPLFRRRAVRYRRYAGEHSTGTGRSPEAEWQTKPSVPRISAWKAGIRAGNTAASRPRLRGSLRDDEERPWGRREDLRTEGLNGGVPGDAVRLNDSAPSSRQHDTVTNVGIDAFPRAQGDSEGVTSTALVRRQSVRARSRTSRSRTPQRRHIGNVGVGDRSGDRKRLRIVSGARAISAWRRQGGEAWQAKCLIRTRHEGIYEYVLD